MRRLAASAPRDGQFALYMVTVPNLVHVAIPALRLISRDTPVIVINNGLRAWERAWLADLFPELNIVDLASTRTMPHGDVMEMVACVAMFNFGFIDPDCYVFARTLYERLEAATRTAFVACPFWTANARLGVNVPDTYLMGVNLEATSDLRRRYNVRFGVTTALPSVLAGELAALWPGVDPRPQPNKGFFDTIDAITLSAVASRLAIALVETAPGDVYHIGGTSYSTYQSEIRADNFWTLRAHSFHLQLLERLHHPELERAFRPLVAHYGGSDGLLRSFPEYVASPEHHEERELVSQLISAGVL